MRAVVTAPALLVLALLVLAPAAALAERDSVDQLCRDRNVGLSTCDCVSRTLRATVGSPDYDVFEEVGYGVLELLRKGRGREEAWAAAIRQTDVLAGPTAGVAGTANRVFGAYQAAFRTCARSDR